MQILGIDFGLKKIGLAVSSGLLTEPLKVIKFSNETKLIGELEKVIKKEKIESIVIGMTDGEIGKEAKKFGTFLASKFSIPVYFQDEALTTKQAQKLAIDAGIRRKKRKDLEDAYSAALILEMYLESEG
jgi:putative Holliday junction resolvase